MSGVLAYICSSTSWGGLEMNHLRAAQWMKERGHKVYFLCVENSRLHQLAVEWNLEIFLIQKHKKYYDFKRGKALVKIVREHGISHLISRSTSDLSILAYVKYKLGSNIHTSYFMEMQFGVKKTHLLHSLRYRYIDVWSCPLPYLQEQVRTMTHFKNRLELIPSGIDLERFGKHTKEEARNQLNLPLDKLILGLAGRFDPQKGQLMVLEAFARAKRDKLHLVLLGEATLHEDGTSYHESMLKVIQENALESQVSFLPFMPNIEVFYAALDYFIMATKSETFGMVTIEALASGVPVIGSNSGGTREILEHGKYGVLFESMNPLELAKIVDNLTKNKGAFDPVELRKAAEKYDHNSVCVQVENALGLKQV